MAVITVPASLRIASIAWDLEREAQVNRSQWSGSEQVIANPFLSRWYAKVELTPILGEANVLAVRAFLGQLKGRLNSFRLIAVENAQTPAGSPTVNSSASAGATSLAVTGFPSGTFNAGRFITVNNQLLMVTTDTSLSGGAGTLPLHAPLRQAATAGTAIEARYPYALMALADSITGWSVGKGQLYGVSLSCEERY